MKYQLITAGKLTPGSLLSNAKLRKSVLDKIESGHDLKDYLDELTDEVLSIKAVSLKADGKLLWEVETNRILTKNEEKQLIDYLTGQCSDGWGEGFEQYPVFYVGDIEVIYSPWKRGTKAQIVKRSKK